MVLIEKRVVLKPHLSLEALFDLNPDGHGCHVVWQDGIRSAAVPRLCRAGME